MIFSELGGTIRGGGGGICVDIRFRIWHIFLHANQITYANTKTPQEQDIAKMNAVQ